MFRTLLIANRGEIARRVARTCRRMGIGVAAVYSDADRGALHVAEADVAVRLPGQSSSETYLRSDLVIDAALKVGADALHPGYGFLSENAELARLCRKHGITFVGPSPEAIEQMGSKIGSKEIMAAAGVPVLPSGSPDPNSPAELLAAAEAVGFPLLVKASAGGGGKAMRIVREFAELDEAVNACRREAASAFADDTVFLERYLEDPRHIEIQVLADEQGSVVHLFERECSIQRRYQKVVEEAPAPRFDPGLRESMGRAAVAAAQAIDYTGVGTVEFLVDAEGGFYFLEMNTRLQVEHPVTEETTGLDLVRLQLLVAGGEPLPKEAIEACQEGHAIEARLYAEDPGAGFLPASGTLDVFDVPTLPGVRLDTGVTSGSVVSIHYDPLLAKVIAWAPSRAEAAGLLASTLERARIHGVTTNRDLLVAVLRHPEFRSGNATTGFLERHGGELLAGPAQDGRLRVHAVAAALAGAAERRAQARVLGAVRSGYRNNPSQAQRVTFEAEGRELTVDYSWRRGRFVVAVDGEPLDDLEVGYGPDGQVDLAIAGVRRAITVRWCGERVIVDSSLGADTLREAPRFPERRAVLAEGSLVAPMPGLVVRVHVKVGDVVARHDPLVVLEAMKMEHTTRAPAPGVVRHLWVSVGDQVDGGGVLAVVEEFDPDELSGP